MFSKIRILPKILSYVEMYLLKIRVRWRILWSKFRNITWSVDQDMGRRLHFVHTAKNYRLKNSTTAQATVSFVVCAIPRSIAWFQFLQVWHMMRESAFHSPRIQRPDLKLCNIVLQRLHWNLGPGLISISPARMRRVIKLVPFEGLKLRISSELLRFPSFLVLAKHWDVPLVKFCNRSYIPGLSQQNPLHSSISKEWVQKPKVKRICRAVDVWPWGDHA